MVNGSDTGSTKIHANFYVKKTGKTWPEVFLKWSQNSEPVRIYPLLRYFKHFVIHIFVGTSRWERTYSQCGRSLQVKFCLFFYVKVCMNFGTSGIRTIKHGFDTGSTFFLKKGWVFGFILQSAKSERFLYFYSVGRILNW